jgi:UDP-3-O-[3-hydroxymyristoyl] glucosamine N-acyltransferase
MVQVSEISNYLKKEYTGENFLIKEVASFDKIANNSIVFLNDNGQRSIPNVDALVLIPKGFDINGFKCAFIEVENPRLSFARVINKYFLTMRKNKGIHQTCVLGDSCMIDESVSIGPNCVIGDGVVIGANTIINNNVVIFDNVIVGDNCYIKSGAIIGEDGFGFEFEQNGLPVRMPHIGNVVIGNNVEIGSNSIIARGTLNSTTIEHGVKIDDHVFIAHNCYISSNTMIAACAEISGSVTIGKNCWIGPNSSIIQKIDIGDNSTIGIGAIITENVGKNKKIMGLNSIELRGLVRLKRRIQYGK